MTFKKARLTPKSVLLAIICCLPFSLYAQEGAADSKIKVVFISPDPPRTGYWSDYQNVMKVSAQDLGIDLEIINSASLDRFAYLGALEQVDKSNTDYVVALLRRNVADNLFKMFEGTKVKVIATNTDVPNIHKQELGIPREIFKNWIGHVMPDDYHAGHLLASTLLAAAQTSKLKSKEFAAISGSRDSTVSFLRNAGLEEVLAHNEYYELVQKAHTDWTYDSGSDRFEFILRRFKDAKIIWSASDELARAVLDKIDSNGTSHEYLVGSIDWSARGIQAYDHNSYVTSVGGHFMEGGIILSLIKDFHNGVDFEESLGVQMRIRMSALNEQNLPILKDILVDKNWRKLKFSRLTNSLGGNNNLLLEDYDAILKAIYVAD